MTDTPKIIILHETVLASWLKDIGSLGGVGALVWFNRVYIGGSWPLGLFCVLLALSFIIYRARVAAKTAMHMTPQELKAWALSQEP